MSDSIGYFPSIIDTVHKTLTFRNRMNVSEDLLETFVISKKTRQWKKIKSIVESY